MSDDELEAESELRLSSEVGLKMDMPFFEFENQIDEGSKWLRRYSGNELNEADMMEANNKEFNENYAKKGSEGGGRGGFFGI